ncbi:MAG: hypothetical protein QOE59_831 [Actinomycetota bacterium]|jgi:hypothetical protein|nr:hypothetical protein [Actinomycetota bacterium]
MNPVAWLQAWRTGTWAPKSLTQPILSGWNFGSILTVNENNSTAPLTEAAIVEEQSYGRQLGTITDALWALLDERPHSSTDKRLSAFIDMAERIEAIKLRTARASAGRIRAELIALERTSPMQYARLVRELASADRATS